MGRTTVNQTNDVTAVDWERLAAAFLFNEARCIDERRYEDWLDLWAADGVYWVPMAHADPNQGLSLIYEDLTRLRDRVDVMLSDTAHPQDPPSGTVRLIGNVAVHDIEQNELTVRSVFTIIERRRGVQTLYAGRYSHRLRYELTEPDAMRIIEKKVDLLGAQEPIGNLSFLL